MPGCVFFFSFFEPMCYQSSVGRSCDWPANLLLRGRKRLSFSNEMEPDQPLYNQNRQIVIEAFTSFTSAEKLRLIADGNWAHVNIFKSEWSSSGTSWGLSSPPCMWLEAVHKDPSHVRCWRSGIGPGASTPWPFTCWICQMHKPEPRLHMHVGETRDVRMKGWSQPNLCLTRIRWKVC